MICTIVHTVKREFVPVVGNLKVAHYRRAPALARRV
jgi:hypothetical protein